MAASNTLTAAQMESDPDFKSFLSVTEAPDMDNTTTNTDNMAFVRRQASRMQGSLLAEAMDKNNTTAILKSDFEHWYSELEKAKLLTIRKDIETALANENPETMKIQDIFKNMAARANQKWDVAADRLVSQDLERAQSLYLTAPNIKHRVDKFKVDAKLMQMWEEKVKKMPTN
jgi:hypothetical protein